MAVLKGKTGTWRAQAGYEALALARQLRDPAAEFYESTRTGVLKAQTGDVAGAQAGYEEALALARQLRDPSAEAPTARAGGAEGDGGRGRGAAAMRRRWRWPGSCVTHPPNARAARAGGAPSDGDVAGAQAGYEEALALARQLRDPAANCR